MARVMPAGNRALRLPWGPRADPTVEYHRAVHVTGEHSIASVWIVQPRPLLPLPKPPSLSVNLRLIDGGIGSTRRCSRYARLAAIAGDTHGMSAVRSAYRSCHPRGYRHRGPRRTRRNGARPQRCEDPRQAAGARGARQLVHRCRESRAGGNWAILSGRAHSPADARGGAHGTASPATPHFRTVVVAVAVLFARLVSGAFARV